MANWIAAGAFVLVAAATSVWSMQQAFGRPASAVATCLERLAAANLAVDSDATRCGESQFQPEIDVAGAKVFRELTELYAKAQQLGTEALRGAERRVFEAGEKAFSNLPSTQRQAIAGASAKEYKLRTGIEALDPNDRALVPDGSVLVGDEPRAALAQKLGEAALAPELRARIEGKSDAELEADAELAAIANARRDAGSQGLHELEARIERLGANALAALERPARRAIELRSKREFVVKHGFAAVSDTDKAALGSEQSLMDGTGAEARAFQLGKELLAPEEKKRLTEPSPAAFAKTAQAVIDREGRRVVGAQMQKALAQARPSVEAWRWQGSLFSWNIASATLQWSDTANARALLSDQVSVTRRGADWEVRWGQ